MKRVREKLAFKVAVVLLCVLTAVAAFLSGMGILFLETYRCYDDPTGKLAQEKILNELTWSNFYEVEEYYNHVNWGGDTYTYEHQFAEENSNFFFRLYDAAGTKVLENYWTKDAMYTLEDTIVTSQDYLKTRTYQGDIFTWDMDNWNEDEGVYEYRSDSGKLLYKYDGSGGIWDVEAKKWGSWYYDGEDTVVEVWATEEEKLTIRCGVAADLHAEDSYTLYLDLVQWLTPMRHSLIAIAVIALLLALASVCFLLWAAGHKVGVDGIHIALWHRIPLDLTAAVVVLAFCFGITCLDYLPWYTTNFDEVLLTIAALILLALLLLALYSAVTLAVRLKAGKWWRNTLIYLLGFRLLRWLWKWVQRFFRALPLVWKTAVICGVIAFADFVVMFAFGYGVSEPQLLLWMLKQLILVPLAIFVSLQMRQLQRSGQALAAGDLSVRTDTSKLVLDFKKHGENLNRISDGMNAAVDARMRSERLKTELITNVSHDLKTPLTSIVNYVDLMDQLPELQPQEAKAYLEVLRRQSARLKKLTEDLVEASKASTGAMPVNLAPTNLHELLRQATGEYEEKLNAANLQLMLDLPPRCTVMADGRLLWRVLDNLLNNCCKYAMPGTRIYLKVTTGQSRAAIFVKNVSRDVLNIDPQTLMERFVRADASRSTEGSGLGLSIARSLIELQQGTFSLHIDGDLFKIEMTLPLAKTVLTEKTEDTPEQMTE